jgi:hypothetical protein
MVALLSFQFLSEPSHSRLAGIPRKPNYDVLIIGLVVELLLASVWEEPPKKLVSSEANFMPLDL